MIRLYLAIGVLVLLLVLITAQWIRSYQRLKGEIQGYKNKAKASELRLNQLKDELEEALNYESRDTETQKRVSRNIELLRKAETDEEVRKEMDTIRSTIRDISFRV